VAGARASKVDALWGSNITVWELLSRAAPELLSAFPPESYDQPVQCGADRGCAVFAGSKGMTASLPDIYWEFARGVLQAALHEFDFFGWNLTSQAVPYSKIVVYLQEDYHNKDSVSSLGYFTSFVMAADWNSDCDGTLYRAASYHWLTFRQGTARRACSPLGSATGLEGGSSSGSVLAGTTTADWCPAVHATGLGQWSRALGRGLK
jgi:hypothetical protein